MTAPPHPPERPSHDDWGRDERIDKRTDVGWNPETDREIPESDNDDDE